MKNPVFQGRGKSTVRGSKRPARSWRNQAGFVNDAGVAPDILKSKTGCKKVHDVRISDKRSFATLSSHTIYSM